jgi:hypothetical protein
VGILGSPSEHQFCFVYEATLRAIEHVFYLKQASTVTLHAMVALCALRVPHPDQRLAASFMMVMRVLAANQAASLADLMKP